LAGFFVAGHINQAGIRARAEAIKVRRFIVSPGGATGGADVSCQDPRRRSVRLIAYEGSRGSTPSSRATGILYLIPVGRAIILGNRDGDILSDRPTAVFHIIRPNAIDRAAYYLDPVNDDLHPFTHAGEAGDFE